MQDLRYLEYFLFTQHSLSTFDKCPLKFKKRYLEGLKWDSIPKEDVVKSLEMGNNFHLMAQRYFMGVETGLTKDIYGYEELEGWMNSLKNKFNKNDGEYLPEYKLRMSKGILRLEANFDLLLIKEDKIEIWDWKTHGKEQKEKVVERGVINPLQTEKKLRESFQTIVYLFVLKEMGHKVLGKEIRSEDIKMLYWQPEPQKILAEVQYSDKTHEIYKEIIHNMINGILNYDYSNFNKELYRKNCKYCEFNWFCNNERVDFEALKEDEDFMDQLEWDEIEELT